MSSHRGIVGLGLACCVITGAWAQPAATELETITVVGTGLPTEVMRSPASVTVISAEDIAHKAPVSIATLLRDVPGVQINEERVDRIAIRGETARRIAILIDGQKLTDHTDYGQPILVDPTTIERIEVVRGSSSVVSGSSAIGGVINIITRQGAARPFVLSTTMGYMSATKGHRMSVTGSGTVSAGPGDVDYRLSLGDMRQGNRRSPDGPLEPSDIKDRSVSGHVGYRLGKHYLGAKVQAFDMKANAYIGIPGFEVGMPQRDLRKTSLFYEGSSLTPWLTKLHFSLHRQTIARDFRNDVNVAAGPLQVRVLSTSLDDQATWGSNLRAEMRFTEHSRTVAGLEWEDDSIEANRITQTSRTPPGIVNTSLRNDDAKIKTWSAFGQHEVSLGEHWTATAGARAYRVRANHQSSIVDSVAQPTTRNSDSALLGSLGLVWSPDKRMSLRANVAQGYIYPTLGQLFLDTTAGGEGTTVGNPDLKPEKSTTWELGARYSASGTVLDATLFYTQSRDYVAIVPIGPRLSTYRNVDAARSWGLELHAEHRLKNWDLTPYSTFAVLRRQLRYANGYRTYDSGTPTFSGRIGVRKDWVWGNSAGTFDLFVRGDSRVRMRNEDGILYGPDTVWTPLYPYGRANGWGTLNLRADVDLPGDWVLVAEFNNLTNRRYTPYEEMPGARRSVNLFLTKSF